MRTDVLDGEDKQLVALALEYANAGKRIAWNDLAGRMRRKRQPQELEQRLRALKRTYGKDITRFPPCLLPKVAKRDIPPVTPPVLTPLQPVQAETAIQDIYRYVSAADVRHQAGKIDENSGEVMPAAVSRIIRMFGEITQGDIFLDVGAGLGHVVAQVALQTKARRCLGIEKRREVVEAGSRCVQAHVPQLAHLRKVLVLIGDVLDIPLSTRAPFDAATIVFLNDLLFTEEAKLVIQQELSHMPKARLIVSTSLYCPRHRSSCKRRFCGKWKQVETSYGRCSWKSQPIPLYLYAVNNEVDDLGSENL
ncbi:Histone methylation protein [Phytophthora megakarya]|uniref:Histone-lysine N-methyltransferase, H3 lysine-79 specific n=1 Tax=Phytophthora megakarya TaxID=4795 RepID=A0A225W7D7_9STRA|nr:Histone methylation protein [Phytophthora megakarya]